MAKILFILKYREVNDPQLGIYSKSGLSSGLFNSARMVNEMFNKFGLNDQDCESKLVQVIDNNDIDREVFNYKPDVVIIEAIWVVPEKFEVLHKLHPTVKWIIRNHSNIPFLAQEGQALNWIAEYVKYKNVYVATNTRASHDDLRDLVKQRLEAEHHEKAAEKVIYFPNYYMTDLKATWQKKPPSKELHVGCFGAIRPLKNHLEQAIAALRYARKHNLFLYFHINAGRPESGGLPILHNLQNLFKDAHGSKLVEHPWRPHAEFIKIIAAMDLSMQVSFSETFNIVTADAVMQGVPIVGSRDVSWISPKYQAEPTSSDDIVEKMYAAIHDVQEQEINDNQKGLQEYNTKSYRAICGSVQQVLDHTDKLGT